MIKIAVVCMGNICRSPMGEYLLRGIAAERGIDVEVCSGGTGDWHLGQGAHPNSVEVLAEIGIDASTHRARQFTPEWFDQHDLILVMDHQNERNVLSQARSEKDHSKVKLFGSFDPSCGSNAEVPDPYGSNLATYREVRDQITRSINGLLNRTVDGIK